MIEVFFILGRIIYGGYFALMSVNHFTKTAGLAQYAASKKVPMAKLAVVAGGLFLLLGGLGIALGVYTELAAFVLVVFLVAVSVAMHNFWAVADAGAKQMEMINFMKNMALAGAALMTLAIPQPWMWSLLG